ncbi:hypothetical protein KCU91_g102, partial [Aureobasidium melanogenum]
MSESPAFTLFLGHSDWKYKETHNCNPVKIDTGGIKPRAKLSRQTISYFSFFCPTQSRRSRGTRPPKT